MTDKLAQIRAQLLANENKTNARSNSWSDGSVYPFWDIPEGDTATLRFLPDANEDNLFFWRERQMIRIPFSGVKGQDEHKEVMVQVPCVEMWGETCPVHAEIRPWFKNPDTEDLARKYWKKRSYIFQGFVTDNPLNEEVVPESPIRRFQINASIFNIIKSALMDPDFPEVPTDYEGGTDFKLTKTKKGQYADYTTSNWARRERSLSNAERDAIATHDLNDLNDFMPKKPSAEGLAAIVEMFHASVNGELYDIDKWGQFYRPNGVQMPATGARADTTTSTPTTTTTAPAAESTTTDEIPFEVPQAETVTETAESAPASNAADILKKIQNRGNPAN